MRLLLFVALVFCLPLSAALPLLVQSEFRGPVNLLVWRHWQPSWNVEVAPDSRTEFVLTRGLEPRKSYPSVPKIRLQFRKLKEEGLELVLTGKAFVRTGEYDTSVQPTRRLTARSTVSEDASIFELEAEDYLDASGKRIVSEIEFEIRRGNDVVYHYRVLPMYVRGAKNHYWNHRIDSFLAHAGSGGIAVANGSSGETGLDRWNGVLVQPQISFMDRNRLSEGAVIGLHRHQRNQEMWIVESGSVEVSNGMASRVSGYYQVGRQVDGKGTISEVPEFKASGGWLETRHLEPGEYAVIVPDPQQEDLVCFHGLRALSRASTFTLGTKN